MKLAYLACPMIVLLSIASCDNESDYYGDDSGDGDDPSYSDTLYDSKEWPLNLDGSLRQRMALNGAIADPGTSFVCSPISALFPLGKLVFGATGSCLLQLLGAVGALSVDNVKSSFTSLLRDFRSLKGVQLTICSRIYVSKGVKLATEFEQQTKAIFRSSVKRVNMENSDRVAKKINNWVNQKTKGMIEEIIKPSDISKDSSVILVNAVYFSGQWKRQFDKPEMQDFYTATAVRKVLMMKAEGAYKYTKSDALDCQMIEIPYIGEHASFVIFLPNTKDGLPILLYKMKLAPELMQSALKQMTTTNVILSIPKFKTSTELDLKTAYQNVGLSDIFKTKRSGLTGIQKGEELYVSKAIQKAVIDVDEFGTRAAASSVVQNRKLSAVLNRKEFKANKPFYYFIKLKKEKLFAGTYIN